MRITAEMFDPIPLGDESAGAVTKFSRHFAAGDRVVLKETGHKGKIINLDDHNRIHGETDAQPASQLLI